MNIETIDHLVLTVRDIEATCAFYRRTLAMEVVTFGAGRVALAFGNHKINLHLHRSEFEPKAARPTPGSADLCLITRATPDEVLAHLADCGVAVLEGPVRRTGARGPITSVYFRDPDGGRFSRDRYRTANNRGMIHFLDNQARTRSSHTACVWGQV